MDDQPIDDTRSKDAKQFDATMDVLLAVVNRLDKLLADEKRGTNSHNQTFHVSSGGWVSLICALISMGCLLGVFGLGWLVNAELTKQNIEHTADIHDLREWRDIHQGRIDKIDAWKASEQEKRK